MPKGFKYCPACNAEVGARSLICDCGHEFAPSRLDTVVATRPPAFQFTIHERFNFISELVGMVAKHIQPSAIITGKGGLGKTYTVIEALEKNGLSNVSGREVAVSEFDQFRVIKGYSTPKGLYRSLFENQNNIIVFDDCDAVLDHDVSLNILKAALDSYSQRVISWNAEMKGDDLPKEFEFKGRVIFISNRSYNSIDQAVRTRSIGVDLTMTSEEMVERMRYIAAQPNFMPEYDCMIKQEALDFLHTNLEHIGDLSLRTLISVIKIRANDGDDWQKFAKYVISSMPVAA